MALHFCLALLSQLWNRDYNLQGFTAEKMKLWCVHSCQFVTLKQVVIRHLDGLRKNFSCPAPTSRHGWGRLRTAGPSFLSNQERAFLWYNLLLPGHYVVYEHYIYVYWAVLFGLLCKIQTDFQILHQENFNAEPLILISHRWWKNSDFL